jgi:hypothetical protein
MVLSKALHEKNYAPHIQIPHSCFLLFFTIGLLRKTRSFIQKLRVFPYFFTYRPVVFLLQLNVKFRLTGMRNLFPLVFSFICMGDHREGSL